MDWGEFWTAISAIGTCAAVIIALWQSGYKTQKRMNAVLKLQEDKIIDSYNGMIKTGHVIKSSAIIDITNTGRYEISICRIEFIREKKYYAILIFSVPILIQIGKTIRFR